MTDLGVQINRFIQKATDCDLNPLCEDSRFWLFYKEKNYILLRFGLFSAHVEIVKYVDERVKTLHDSNFKLSIEIHDTLLLYPCYGFISTITK